ncbi:hypothetical protein ABID21_003488 [Pseudorhizobium tarimense]|uniref:Uncharacterized protein n=1 Tax=Pseudorhizobium tarimense TaxID=1079109 RepID=A0ABV2H9Y6_9HYPH|nr:hypothetical protein [Pseudorhizobium tarimense]MCJ8520622.1 hypothetical protein [Pseudorhizobium tarimense]
MRVHSAADMSPELAAAIGCFVQASALLERAIEAAITRILPITDDIGLAMLCDNSMRNNLDILSRLLALPDVVVEGSWRERLLEAIPKVKESTEDRNRLVHNVVAHSEAGFVAAIHKKGKRIMHPIDATTISRWADEAGEHAFIFTTVPHSEYDLSAWGKDWPRYEQKDWPNRRSADGSKGQ